MSHRHQTVLVAATVLSRLLTFLLLHSSSHLPLFDSSPLLVTTSKWAQPLLRWDSFHFLHIAEHGYVYENEWAFFPGVPFVMRASSSFLRFLGGPNSRPDLLVAGALAAMACDTTRTLYQLTLHHLGSPTMAYLAALLSIMPSNPATLYLVPYSEPFFTYLSYKGMLCCAEEHWMPAALLFAFAGTFRSNGILLSGFILWGLLIQPFLENRKLSLRMFPYPIALVFVVLAPFVYHNYSGYVLFCTDTELSPPWCHTFPPSIYTYVQARYWNVGFLRYWTLAQAPNFIIATPPFAAVFLFSLYHLRHGAYPRSQRIATQRLFSSRIYSKHIVSSAIFLHPALTPHAIHALFLSTTVLFTSHTQIILRLAASMPFTYWAAAWLLTENPHWGRWWISWSLVWGALSVVLWGVCLPPA